jgi:hypothetical protein
LIFKNPFSRFHISEIVTYFGVLLRVLDPRPSTLVEYLVNLCHMLASGAISTVSGVAFGLANQALIEESVLRQ